MQQNSPASAHPPRPALCCTVGVTGHRPDLLGEGDADRLHDRIATIITEIAASIGAIGVAEARWFASETARLRCVSPLAQGADQMSAEAALAAGYELSVVMPFAEDVYAADFEGAAYDRFRILLAQATGRIELPGRRDHSLDAYVMAGRATVAQADLMIAVWDGKPARGRGGTGEVVDLALRRGKPVIHVPLDPTMPVRLLWAGYTPVIVATQTVDVAAQIYDRVSLDAVTAQIFAPPAIDVEREQLALFLDERERTIRTRIEYPLLLAVTGVRGLSRSVFRIAPYANATCPEWARFHHATAAERLSHHCETDALERQYCWADRLAQHYAQIYRSGHVLNFALAGLAVILALLGLLLPGIKLWLTLAELCLIAAIVMNTHVGGRRGWHRRWLDYRHLAEQLRPMRSIKLFAVAQPEFATADERRWVDWYAATIWRAMGVPRGTIRPDDLKTMGSVLLEEELQPQIAYHHASAHQLEHLDHRLHVIGSALFAATIVTCTAFVLGYGVFHDWVVGHAKIFVFLSGGLPALGSAIFGIRVQGDFIGAAERSRATAARLDVLGSVVMTNSLDIARAGDLVEAASQTMLADLGEWRVSYSHRKLVIPA